MRSKLLYILLFVLNFQLNAQEKLKTLYFKDGSTDLNKISERQLKKLSNTYLRGDLILQSFYVFKDSAQTNPLVDSLCSQRIKIILKSIGVVSFKNLQTGTKILALGPDDNLNKQLRKIDIRYTTFSDISSDSLAELQKSAIAQNNKIEEVAVWNDTKNPNAKPKYNVPYLLNIKFIEGKSKIQSESYAEIERLFGYLSNNAKLTIVIRGHVCCGNNDRISKNRAKAVFKELRHRGISKNRMQYVGLSNREPLAYPEKSNADRQKNRRVDIKLLLLEIEAN